MEENMPKKNNKSLLIAVIMLTVAGLLIGSGLIISSVVGGSSGGKPSTPTKEEQAQQASSILEELNINNYLKYVFTDEVPVNENLLDITSGYYMTLYFSSNEDLKKYKIYFQDSDIVYNYVKYNEYLSLFRNVFGENPELNVEEFGLNFSNLIDIGNNVFKFNNEDVTSCTSSDYSNCYIFLTEVYVSTDSVEFSDLSIKDNVIDGKIRLILNAEESKSYLDGTFEFEYSKDGNDYHAESLKIKSIDGGYKDY